MASPPNASENSKQSTRVEAYPMAERYPTGILWVVHKKMTRKTKKHELQVKK
jgi:hypothetical protein